MAKVGAEDLHATSLGRTRPDGMRIGRQELQQERDQYDTRPVTLAVPVVTTIT